MKNTFTHPLPLATLLLALLFTGTVSALEVAPRISDREIIERLTRLEEGQRAMQQSIQEQIAAMQKQIAAAQKQTDQRFLSMEKRLDAQWNLTLVMIAAIFGLVGFVVWDRKTALRPLEKRFERLADDIERDLDLESPEGSRLTRVIEVLREIARKDPQLVPQLVDALRRHSLLADMPHKAKV